MANAATPAANIFTFIENPSPDHWKTTSARSHRPSRREKHTARCLKWSLVVLDNALLHLCYMGGPALLHGWARRASEKCTSSTEPLAHAKWKHCRYVWPWDAVLSM